MAVKINFNEAAAQTHTSLIRNERAMNKSLLRLSTGMRILNAADDSAGLFIADMLGTVGKAYEQGNRNIQTGISALQIAEASAGQIFDKLQEIYTRAQNAANDINDPNARAALQQEINNFIDAIQKIGTDTEYNGIKLLDGTFSNKYIHYGARMDQTISIGIKGLRAQDLGAYMVDGNGRKTSGTGGLTSQLQNTNFYIDTTDSFKVKGKDIISASDAGKLLDAALIAKRINADADLQAEGISAVAKNKSVASDFVRLFQERLSTTLSVPSSSLSGTSSITGNTNLFFGTDDTLSINGYRVNLPGSGMVSASALANAINSNTNLTQNYNVSATYNTTLNSTATQSYTNNGTSAVVRGTYTYSGTGAGSDASLTATAMLKFYVGNTSNTFSVTLGSLTAGASGASSTGGNLTLSLSSLTAVVADINTNGNSFGLSATYDSSNRIILSTTNGASFGVEALITYNETETSGGDIQITSLTFDLSQIIQTGPSSLTSSFTTNTTDSVLGYGARVQNLQIEIDDSLNFNPNGIGYSATNIDAKDAQIRLDFYVGENNTAAFSLTGLKNDITLSELVNRINTAASAANSPITAKIDNNRLVLETTNGETVAINAEWTNSGTNVNSVRINFDQLLGDLTSSDRRSITTTAGSDNQAYAIKVGTLNIYGIDNFTVFENGVDIVGNSGADGNIDAFLKTLNTINVTDNTSAEEALLIVDKALQKTDKVRAQIGAIMNNLQSIFDSQKTAFDNTKEAESVIRNTDYAKEMSEFTTFQIRMQSTIAMLAQANTLPQLVLQLLR